MNVDEFDEYGLWTGTCEKCGTNHDGFPPDTVGGELRCVRNRARQLGASHLVDQADSLQRDIEARRERAIREHFES